MKNIINGIVYVISFIPLITGSYFDIYYLMMLMLFVVFAENVKGYEIKKIRISIFLGSASVMIYTILMGRNDNIVLEFLMFVFGVYLFGKLMEEMKNTKKKARKSKLEKYFMPSISQLAIFLIIMLVMQEMTAMTIYIIISYAIVYVFSKNIDNLFEMMYFMVTQVAITFLVFSFNETMEITEMVIYIMIIINSAISGFYGKIKNKR